MRLILLRHGETLWNKEHRLQGHLNSPLSEKGIAQAKAIKPLIEKFSLKKLFAPIWNAPSKPLNLSVFPMPHRIAICANLPWGNGKGEKRRDYARKPHPLPRLEKR
ncbi:phosphoglycerate mutase [Aggregatibacter actinomycetemcomitans ANH9381]|nr:phosphoglycerate mutase [Aggregatibacter actinomycetemcomitans ANH9381]